MIFDFNKTWAIIKSSIQANKIRFCTWSMFRSEASFIIISSFSILTYIGSLYLQKKTYRKIHYCVKEHNVTWSKNKSSKNVTLISWASIVGLFWTIKLMFLKATYWISGSADRRVTRGGAIFLQRFLTTSVLVMSSICRRIILKHTEKEH